MLFEIDKLGSAGYRQAYDDVAFTVRARTTDTKSLVVENNGGGGAFTVDAGGRVGVREHRGNATFNIKARDGDDNWLRVEKPSTTETIFRVRQNGAHVDLGDMTIHNGDLYISVGSFFNTSDRRLKNDIAEMDDTLNKVMELRPSTYRYNEEGANARKRIGMIAQEVAEVYPELVTEKDGFLRLDYTSFGVIAIQAIQEQQTQIKMKDEKVKALEARLARLKGLMLQSGKSVE